MTSQQMNPLAATNSELQMLPGGMSSLKLKQQSTAGLESYAFKNNTNKFRPKTPLKQSIDQLRG